MISVEDLALEIYLDDRSVDRETFRRTTWNVLIVKGMPSAGMRDAFDAARVVLRLAEQGAFSKSPVVFKSTDGERT